MELKINKTLAQIAKIIDGKIVGDPKLKITGLNGIKEAKEGDITFVANSKYFSLVKDTKASAVIAPKDFKEAGKPIIKTDNPSLAFAQLAAVVIKADTYKLKGIHKTAVIAKSARLEKNVAVGPHVVIEADVKIGEGTTIAAGCFVGHETTIGNGCLFYPNVTIRERAKIGNNVIIHSGSVIGSDGFGFENVGGVHEKIPQMGTVVIEDNVEIGANVTIDRARFDKTLIGKGTKIDNLVQIGHNVTIGENCILVAQVGIAGSVVIKKGVILAGQVGVGGHLTIGEGAIIAAKAGVIKSVPPHSRMFGYPARPHRETLKAQASVQRLPIFINSLKELQKRVEELEEKLKIKNETKDHKKRI